MRIPDCHLVLEVTNLGNLTRALIDALLRVDLGARIKPDTARGTVDIEGRFWKNDVIAAAHRSGCRIVRIEELPLSPKLAPSAPRGWV